MRRSFSISLLSCLFLAGTANPLHAEMEWSIQKKISLESPPIDTAVAALPDGSPLLFVLMEKGALQVYSATGELKDKVKVSETASNIDVSPRGDMIILSDKTAKTVEVVNFDFPAKFDLTDSPVRGAANAPVTLALFSDFQCPYCSKVGPLLDQVLKQYPNDVKVVFKHMPLVNIHKAAMDAAKASMAANAQGRFWEFHDKLFENQANINESRFNEIAQQLGLDMAKFAKDKEDEKVKRLVGRDMQEAATAAVSGTPTIFLNGKRLKQRSFEEIQRVIDSELARLKKK